MIKSDLEKNEVAGLIEPHLERHLTESCYKAVRMDPTRLLSHNRFDLAIKLFYLHVEKHRAPIGRMIYSDHIRAFSGGTYSEPEDTEKNNLEQYLVGFKNLFADIKCSGFDPTQSLVPISIDGYLLNGAHRVSASIEAGQSIYTVPVDVQSPMYNFEYFRRRGMRDVDLDAAAIEFVDRAADVYIAVVWPAARATLDELRRWFGNLVYLKEFELNERGAGNFTTEVYTKERWVSGPRRRRNNGGVHWKVAQCFTHSGPVRVVAFQPGNDRSIQELKQEIRAYYRKGNHSIHITDDKHQAQLLARLSFSENGVEFLNVAIPGRFRTTSEKVDGFRQFLSKAGKDPDDCVVDSGLVLSVYGIREAQDTDYIEAGSQGRDGEGAFNSHDSELQFHRQPAAELVWNPRYHFYYRGLKFLALGQVLKMKRARRQKKDRDDLVLATAVRDRKEGRRALRKLTREWVYVRNRVRIRAKAVASASLKTLGLYEYAARMYRRYFRSSNS